MTTVSSYLLIQYNQERAFKVDPLFFILDKGFELHQVESIRNQCL